MDDEKDFIVIFEAPVIEKPEFRLYYDEQGKVVCYTTEKLEGNYLVIDKLTFAECRPDIRVIDKKIIRNYQVGIICKLKPDSNGSTQCATDDISIITDDTSISTTKWEYKLYGYT